MKIRVVCILMIMMISVFKNPIYGQIHVQQPPEMTFQDSFFEALKHKAIGNHERAIGYLEACLKIKPESVAVMFELSKNFLSLDRFQEAMVFIDQALENEGNNEYLKSHKIDVLVAQGQLSKAIELRKSLNDINGRSVEDLVGLYIRQGDTSRALDLIQEYKDKGQASIGLYELEREIRPHLPRLNSSESASNDIADLEARYKNSGEYKELIALLKALSDKGEYDKLVSTCEDGIGLFPLQGALYYWTGFGYNALGNYNSALQYLEIGIEFVVDNNVLKALFYDEISRSYDGKGEVNEAKSFRAKAKTLRNES